MRSTRRTTTGDVAFAPGKTADGRDVVPADLDDGSRPQLADVIPIPITTEHEDYYDLPFNSPLFEADAVIGLLAYDRVEHRFTFNGVELGDPEQRRLAAQCRAHLANPPIPRLSVCGQTTDHCLQSRAPGRRLAKGP